MASEPAAATAAAEGEKYGAAIVADAGASWDIAGGGGGGGRGGGSGMRDDICERAASGADRAGGRCGAAD